MARIRTIKPEFPHSESMGRVSRDARLTFIQLWTLADDSGRLRGNSRMLASLLFPYDDDAKKLIEGWLNELEQENCIQRYLVRGISYIQVCNWLMHQKIDRPSVSKLPHPEEGSRILANPREMSSEDQGSGSRIKEGIKEGIKDHISAATPPRAAVERVFGHWQTVWNHPGTELDRKRRKCIEDRLKSFTAEQLCDAISGFRNSPWHCGTDPKGNGTVYDKLETLLRDSAQVETGMRLLARPPQPPKVETPHERAERLLQAWERGDSNSNSEVIEHEPDFLQLTRG